MPDVMLAYATPAGRAHYIGGSGLSGAPQYALNGRTYTHSAICALSQRRNRRGERRENDQTTIHGGGNNSFRPDHTGPTRGR